MQPPGNVLKGLQRGDFQSRKSDRDGTTCRSRVCLFSSYAGKAREAPLVDHGEALARETAQHRRGSSTGSRKHCLPRRSSTPLGILSTHRHLLASVELAACGRELLSCQSTTLELHSNWFQASCRRHSRPTPAHFWDHCCAAASAAV